VVNDGRETCDIIEDLHTEIQDLREALQLLVDNDLLNYDWENGRAKKLREAYSKAREVLSKYPKYP
jgi:hypothetical protein